MTRRRPKYWVPITVSSLRAIFSQELVWWNSGGANGLLADHQGISLHPANGLALYAAPPSFCPSASEPALLLVDAAYLASRALVDISESLSFYHMPLFLRLGNFQLRVPSEEAKRRIEAECAILLEAKGVRRYIEASFNREGKAYPVVMVAADQFSSTRTTLTALPPQPRGPAPPDMAKPYIQYDTLKGFLYGWAIGQQASACPEDRELVELLTDIRNKFSGLRTRFEMTRVTNGAQHETVADQLSKARKVVRDHALNERISPLLTAATKRLKEIGRFQALQEQEWPSLLCKMEKEAASTEGADSTKIDDLHHELEVLKQEVQVTRAARNSIEEQYKSIKRPRRGTPEHERKAELKAMLEDARMKAREAREGSTAVRKELTQQPKEYRPRAGGVASEYAAAANGLFQRVSSGLKNAIDIVEGHSAAPTQDDVHLPLRMQLDNEVMPGGALATIEDPRLNEGERSQLAAALNYISEAKKAGASGRIVLIDLMDKLRVTESVSDGDRSACDAIASYLSGLSLDVNFSQENRVLANLMALAIRDSSPDDLARLAQKKNLALPEISFGLQGALLGYTGMPKTFTDSWYVSDNLAAAEALDDYLWKHVMPAAFGEYAPQCGERKEDADGVLPTG
jgi:hypothetical protein